MGRVLQFLNGDSRRSVVSHVCSGCCSSREEAVDNVHTALLECDVLCGKGGLPSAHRRGSVATSNSQITLGVLLHKVLPRVWRLAFPDYHSGAVDPAEQIENEADEDFKTNMKNKVYRCGKFLSERSSRACTMSFVTEPIDWLWHRLQHLDETSSSLSDIACSERNPFNKAQACSRVCNRSARHKQRNEKC